ncbi:MAG TPA: crossover junction endodeoxyribonuclease RuvC [Blastocatellia bacterium]|nr:crossover junction endodeoxyribonuclease RuvC [Blastocatellia bacterium]
MNSPKVLAIDPGTRHLGVVVLSTSQLLYFGIKTFRRPQPPHERLAEIAHCIRSLIGEHRPAALAIEQTSLVQKNATLLNVAAAEIKCTAQAEGLPVYEYAPAEARRVLCEDGRATKHKVVQVLAGRFPELARLLNNQTKWEELYWVRMFDALAVGVRCLGEPALQPPLPESGIENP